MFCGPGCRKVVVDGCQETVLDGCQETMRRVAHGTERHNRPLSTDRHDSPARLEGRTKMVAIVRAILSLGVVTVLLPTGGRPPATGVYTVTDRALGLSLTVPRTWIREPAGKFAPGYLAFVRPQPGQQEDITELVVEPLGLTKVRDPRRAARAWACGLTKGLAFPVRQGPGCFG